MSANETRGFLELILAAPDDDTPRLVFADWLDEHDGPDRAEFIRVQIERTRMPAWDARQVGLRLRERVLIEQHGEKWKAELPTIKGVTWDGFRRGFVGTATSNFAALAESAGACWGATPLEAVSVRWPHYTSVISNIAPIKALRELSLTGTALTLNEVGLLADAPLLSTLRTFNARNCSLGGAGFRRLLASPHLGNLTALRVPLNAIGREGARALADAASLTSLTELDLAEAGNYGRSVERGRYREDPVIAAADLAALARWPGLAGVRSLTLSGNDVGGRGLRALLRSPHATGLKELTLRANSFDPKALQGFGEARPGLQLDVLDLGENAFGDVGVSDLALAPCLRELKVLELDRCEIHLSGARWLAGAPFLQSLRRLNVNDNSISAEGLYRLLEKKPRWLHTLQMAGNELGDEGAYHVAESSASGNLLDVDVGNNGVGDPAARALAKSSHLRNMLVLRLAGNPISKAAADALTQSFSGKRVTLSEEDEDNPV
jgi:uncharacterized protein (TIGR02996 family)